MKKLFLLLTIALISFSSQAQSEEPDEYGWITLDSAKQEIEEEDVAVEEDSDDFVYFIYWSVRAEFSDLEYRYFTEEEYAFYKIDSLNTVEVVGFIQTDWFRKGNLEEAIIDIRQECKIFQSVNLFQFYCIYITCDKNNKYQIDFIAYNLKEPLISTYNSIDDEW